MKSVTLAGMVAGQSRSHLGGNANPDPKIVKNL